MIQSSTTAEEFQLCLPALNGAASVYFLVYLALPYCVLAQTLALATPVFAPGVGSYPLPTNVVVTCATYSINTPPVVHAGAQQIFTSSSTTLEGFVADDGLTGGGTQFTEPPEGGFPTHLPAPSVHKAEACARTVESFD